MDLKELLAQINNKVEEVKNLVAQDKIEEAKKAKEELDKLQAKYDLLKDFENENPEQVKDGIIPTKPVNEDDAIKQFANAARNGFPVNMMSEGTPSEGGYTVPEDIQTQINEYRESKFSLQDLVTVSSVKTKKGSRTFKKRAQQTGFTKVGEGGKIGKKNTPQFERLEYEIADYAGYFPVTNDLLEDSDANISGTLVAWIGDESRVTRNKLIIDTINTNKAKVDLKDTDGIKKAFNVTLGSAFSNTSKIITNDDGFNWLDTLKDKDGKYLLQPMVSDPTQFKIFGKEVKVIPNSDMESDVSVNAKRTIPFILGDLKEGVVLFERKITTITSSDIATAGDLNAFEQNLTLWRAIEREDCKLKDSEAIVNGTITIDDDSVVVP